MPFQSQAASLGVSLSRCAGAGVSWCRVGYGFACSWGPCEGMVGVLLLLCCSDAVVALVVFEPRNYARPNRAPQRIVKLVFASGARVTYSCTICRVCPYQPLTAIVHSAATNLQQHLQTHTPATAAAELLGFSMIVYHDTGFL